MLSEREEALGTCWALGGEGDGRPWSDSLDWVLRVGAGMLARCPHNSSCSVLSCSPDKLGSNLSSDPRSPMSRES